MKRDVDYIKTRLDDPVAPAREAQERMRENGFVREADQLAQAIHDFEETTRDLRSMVLQKARARGVDVDDDEQ